MRLIGQLAVSWLCNAIILGIVAWIFTGVHGGTTGQLLAAAAIFGVLNTFLKPILKLLTLPLAFVTLGLAWFFVSMGMLALTDWLVKGFDIDGFWNLVWATIGAWVVNLVIEAIFFFWDRPSHASGPTAIPA